MLHSVHRKQLLKTDLPTLWKFISSPTNLANITPPHLGFFVLSDIKDKKMYAGQIIEYYVSPFKGFNFHWVTEITHVREEEYFVDEQRFGPYSFWHHQHILKQVQEGVEMIDIVHYRVPGFIFGKLINRLFVQPKLETIFEYRYQRLDELFNAKKDNYRLRQ